MSVLDEISSRGHEQVQFFFNRSTGLRAIVAIHDTTLGASLGGCRMRQYSSIDDALFDVLSLSEAMTYKNSLAGLNSGGGKSVIIADHMMTKGRDELFSNFGQVVQSLAGKYITAEDMGTSVADMGAILRSTEYVTGRDPKIGGGGDPSPYTATGVFDGIKACLERVFGLGSYMGRHFAVQGIGHVGYGLAKLLVEAGGKLTIADTRNKELEAAAREFSAQVVAPEKIVSTPCDVFVPCAVGRVINKASVGTLQCKVVAGAANNQMDGAETEKELVRRGIMYAPDFAINAGGVILCADELEPGGFTKTRVNERVSRIYHTVGKILDEAKRTQELPGAVAVRLAKERIEQARAQKH